MDTSTRSAKRPATEPAEEESTEHAEYIKTDKGTSSRPHNPVGGQPKGKGKSKGKVAHKQHDSVELHELVQLNTKACIRLLQQQRELTKETQLIIEIPTTATDLRTTLGKAY